MIPREMDLSEKRVLVVEQHDALRTILSALLRRSEIPVDTAADFETALERVAGCDYALMLIDLSLEPEAACEFLQTFRALRPEATTFVLGFTDGPAGDIPEGARIGALLQKPFELSALSGLIRECTAVIELPEERLPCGSGESEQYDFDDSATAYH